MAGSKSSLLIDSPIMRMQLTETTFAGISPTWIPRIGCLLTSTQIQAFFLLDVILLSYK